MFWWSLDVCRWLYTFSLRLNFLISLFLSYFIGSLAVYHLLTWFKVREKKSAFYCASTSLSLSCPSSLISLSNSLAWHWICWFDWNPVFEMFSDVDADMNAPWDPVPFCFGATALWAYGRWYTHRLPLNKVGMWQQVTPRPWMNGCSFDVEKETLEED